MLCFINATIVFIKRNRNNFLEMFVFIRFSFSRFQGEIANGSHSARLRRNCKFTSPRRQCTSISCRKALQSRKVPLNNLPVATFSYSEFLCFVAQYHFCRPFFNYSFSTWFNHDDHMAQVNSNKGCSPYSFCVLFDYEQLSCF